MTVLPAARARDDTGFTLVEVIATVVIMGLIVVPLCTTLTQSLNLIPQNGDRTQVATDADAMSGQYADDVAQGQSLGIAALPPTATVTCKSAGTAADLLFASSWTDPLGTSATTPTSVTYYTNYLNGGATMTLIQVTRVIKLGSPSGRPTTTVLLTGYCKPSPADTLATVTLTPRAGSSLTCGLGCFVVANGGQSPADLRTVIKLRDKAGNRRQDLVFDASNLMTT